MAEGEASGTQDFLQYHEPGIISILIIISFFVVLWLFEYLSSRFIRAGILGSIVAGIIYGRPLANILHEQWQETFVTLGYIGLILIIFEGGLTARLDLLRANLVLSMFAAVTGVIFPIAFSYLLLYLGYGYGAVETFIIGAALSATSLGTTFAVISGASKASVDLSQTRVGTVLMSAAVLDDVSGLVMSSVIHGLGGLSSGGISLGWLIGRPVLASILMAIFTPVLSHWLLAPLFRRYIEHRFARYEHLSNVVLIILVLSAFLAIASYAGTSVLFGAFLAGLFLTYLPSKHPEDPSIGLCRGEGQQEHHKAPTFVHTFEYYCADVQHYILAPLFFASIGFATPFLSLWTGEAIWRGVVYTLLMLAGKFVVGACLPIWAVAKPSSSQVPDNGTPVPGQSGEENLQHKRPVRDGDDASSPSQMEKGAEGTGSKKSRTTRLNAANRALYPGLLLGLAMVARGEIGLLIVEIGYNNTEYVSEAGFITAIWAILLNTILGPVAVGILVKYKGSYIGHGQWGLVPGPMEKLRTERKSVQVGVGTGAEEAAGTEGREGGS